MLVLALLLIARADVPSAAPAAATEEIVVLARRLGRVRVDYRLAPSGQVSSCRVTRSSGDAAVDRIGCGALRECAANGASDRGALRRCVARHRRELLNALAAAAARRQ
jgi:TonB family protein